MLSCLGCSLVDGGLQIEFGGIGSVLLCFSVCLLCYVVSCYISVLGMFLMGVKLSTVFL